MTLKKMTSRASAKVACKYHPDADLIEDSHAGDMICQECGLVVGDRVIDVTSEWRSFSNSDDGAKDRSRVGAAENPALDNASLSTTIGAATGAASFNEDGQLKYRSRQQKPTSDRNMLNAIRELETLAHRMNVPQSIVEAAADIYRRVQESGKFSGRSHDPIISACMYIACRNQGVARTFREVVAVSQAKRSDIIKMFKAIVKVLEQDMSVVSSAELVNRFCGRLDLDQKCVRVAINICQQCTELNLLSGRNYTTVAATAIYMAANGMGWKKSASDVGEAAGCAETTIKTAYKSLLPLAKKLFPLDDVKWDEVKVNLPK